MHRPYDANQSAPRSGLILLQALVLGLFCVFSLRLWYLQVHKGAYFAEKARENRLRQEPLYAPRGLIFDRDGVLLAENEPAYALGLVREDCANIEDTLRKVSQWTGEPLDKLEDIYALGRRTMKSFEPIILVPDLSFEEVARIEAGGLRWPGLEVVVRPRRTYKYGELLAHVQGYVAEASEEEMKKDPKLSLGDTVGKQGLELVLEQRLRGAKGRRQLEVDATGRALAEYVLAPPQAGQDVTLSIDLDIQRLAWGLLQGKAGAVVVMDPDTGQILAFVSSPSYDSNAFTTGLSTKQWSALRDDPMHPMTNRVIQAVYPPGSVFKLVVAGVALANGVDIEETFYCPGHLKFGGRVFNCWKKGGHGRVDMRKGLIESCDVYFYKIGDRLGVDAISDFAMRCGFGAPTGVDLPHEKSGLIPTREWKRKRHNERWQGGENLNLAIGQGYTLASPLQVARFIAALSNGGVLYKPMLLAGEKPVEQGRLPLDAEQLAFLRTSMIDTVEVEGGTARRLHKRGATIGAKTGTAQVVKLMEKFEDAGLDEIPYRFRDHAWMASFGEKDGRRYVVVGMVEHGGHGSSGAGPVVRSIYDYLFGAYATSGQSRIGGGAG